MKEINKLSFEEIRILEHKIEIENYLKEELKKELSKDGRPNIERFNEKFKVLERLEDLLNE